MDTAITTLRKLFAPLYQHRALAASLICFWTFHFIVLWSSVFALGNPQGSLDLSNDFTWLIAIVCNALALLACALMPGRGAAHFDRLVTLAGSAAALGIVCIALRVAHEGLVFDLTYLGGTVLFGLGTGLLMGCYADRLRAVTPQTTFMMTAAAFFAGAVLCLLVSTAFVPAAAWIVTALLPLATAALYQRGCLSAGATAETSEQATIDRAQTAVENVQVGPEAMPLKSFFCLIGIIGLTAGLVRGTSYGTIAPAPPDFLFIGTVMVGGALLFALSFVVDRLKPTLLLQVVVVIISGAFLMGALLAGPATPVAFVLHTLGFLFFVALVWLFCTYLSNGKPQGARLFIAGLLANQAGQALGSVAFLGVLTAFGPEATAALPISLGTLYVLLIAALVFFANTGRSKRSTADPSLAATSPATLLQHLAVSHHLTAREVEIGALVAEGLSRADIADRLTVSQETVKTHAKHLYQKLDVHSRTELLALLEREMEREAQRTSLL